MHAWFRVTVAIVVLLGCLPIRGWGQDVKLDAAQGYLASVVKDEMESLARDRLLLRLELMDRVLQLSKTDVAKLKIAAKGAAAQFAEKRGGGFKETFQRMRFPMQGSFTINDRSLTYPDNEPEAKPTTRITMSLTNYGCKFAVRWENRGFGTQLAGGIQEIYRQTRWTKSLEEVVSLQQRRQFDQYERRQINDSCRMMILAYINGNLLLTDAQRPKVAAWLEDQVGDTTFKIESLNTPPVTMIRDDSRLKEILTEGQWKVWQDRVRVARP